MNSTYAQKSSTVQKAADSKAASILDSSSQGESLQRKADMANGTVQRKERPNNTGMPDNLKSGIESLSGFSMDDVRVHYNSSKPAAVQALAYTQGTDIHVAPGQEKCLPHEAWHVAQQMAGRVSPTTNINGMPVNDNAALEHEADVMGEKAVTQRFEMEKDVVRENSVKSCAQMFFEHRFYEQGKSIIKSCRMGWFKRRKLLKKWKWLKERISAFDALQYDGGDELKEVIANLKYCGTSEHDLIVFKDVLTKMKTALFVVETNKGCRPESSVHFKQVCANAILKCGSVKDSIIRLFFGNGADVNYIKRRFQIIANRLKLIKDNEEFVNTYTQSLGVFAYVKTGDIPRTNWNPNGDKHAGKIRLCSGYRMAEDDGLDSKPGVLIHETSHLALGTEDHEYGGTACIELAKKDPDSAVMNADSYEYAAECS